MKLGIVTDSTSDLPADLVAQHAIEVVPAVLVIEGQSYIDGQSLTREEFYARLPDFKTAPTTAAPSIGDFHQHFEKLFAQGCEHVISIHAAGTLTAIGDIARQAAADFPGRVTVVDSLSLSLGLGFQVLAAAEATDLQTTLAAIESTRQRLHVHAALDTMEYLRRSGRVPAAVTMIGTALSIKPLIELTEGQVKIIGVVRTTRQANERLAALLKAKGKLEHLAILHTGAEARARTFLDGLMHDFAPALPRDILMLNVTSVIGTHLGPNGLGFAAVRE